MLHNFSQQHSETILRTKGWKLDCSSMYGGFPGGFKLAQRGKGVKEIYLSKERGSMCVGLVAG